MSIFKKSNCAPRGVWTNPLEFVACGFGFGAMPWMPGTFGTIIGVIFYLLLSQLSLWIYGVIVFLFFVFGVMICDIVSRRFGAVDHSAIVWDEIVGFLVIMVGVPKMWYFVAVAFILFRLFDIWKPWPIKQLEKNFRGGFGVMIDDFVAALYGWIIMMVIVYGGFLTKILE